MVEVSLRGGFSDRTGIKKVNTEIQLTEFDERTRMAFVNVINFLLSRIKVIGGYGESEKIKANMARRVLKDVYSEEVDYNNDSFHYTLFKDNVSHTIKFDKYNAVLDVVEYVARELDDLCLEFVYKHFNEVFEKEYVGYRFVNREIAPITDEIEVLEIELACKSPHEQVNTHLGKALDFLSDRESPDYENSIKESISAVECICSIIIGESTSLGKALSNLESKGLSIHPALKSAFEKLFGYTSDATGIRHAGQQVNAKSTFEEAKFMLVSCCAFVNYLLGNMSDRK